MTPYACAHCPSASAQLSAQTAAKYRITANANMAFAGSVIVLDYDLTGAFPSLRGDYTGGVNCWADGASADNCTLTPFANVSVVRNGGVLQAADVEAVANHTKAALQGRVPANFSGLLVLDFEAWRPLSADNDAPYSPLSTGGGYTLSQYGRQLVQQQPNDSIITRTGPNVLIKTDLENPSLQVLFIYAHKKGSVRAFSSHRSVIHGRHYSY